MKSSFRLLCNVFPMIFFNVSIASIIQGARFSFSCREMQDSHFRESRAEVGNY